MCIRNNRAFTLIELLVVVLIIGILSAIALPQYSQAVEKSRAAEALSNIGSFSRAVDIWALGNPDKDSRCFAGNCYGAGQLDIAVPDDWVQGTGAMIKGKGTPGNTSCSKNFCYSIDTSYVTAYRANSSTYKYDITYYRNSKHYVCQARTSEDLKLCKSLSNMDSVSDATGSL